MMEVLAIVVLAFIGLKLLANVQTQTAPTQRFLGGPTVLQFPSGQPYSPGGGIAQNQTLSVGVQEFSIPLSLQTAPPVMTASAQPGTVPLLHPTGTPIINALGDTPLPQSASGTDGSNFIGTIA